MANKEKLPCLVIIGRPNVGKSSLFNYLAERRISIVDDFEGLTRDYVSCNIPYNDRWFEIVDTGGIGIVDKAGLSADVEKQITMAIDRADVILFVIDFKAGLVGLDYEITERLRKLNKDVILAVNKVDHPKFDDQASEYYSLGFGEPLYTSSRADRGNREILARLSELAPADEYSCDEPAEDHLKVAIVGKRNAGKSTLVNQLAGEDRVIVSEIEGTTRDAVDIELEYEGKSLVLIDTAGLRKDKSVSGSIDYYSQHRAREAVRRANVIIFMIDAFSKISQVDKKLAKLIVDSAKPVIVAINKWDLVEQKTTPEVFMEYLEKRLPNIRFAPVVFISAKKAWRVKEMFGLVQELYEQGTFRVGTGELNRLILEAVKQRKPFSKGGKRPRIYYASQVDVLPPVFLFFVNRKESFSKEYSRYLEGFFRRNLPFNEVPLRLIFRDRSRIEKGTIKDEDGKSYDEENFDFPSAKEEAELDAKEFSEIENE